MMKLGHKATTDSRKQRLKKKQTKKKKQSKSRTKSKSHTRFRQNPVIQHEGGLFEWVQYTKVGTACDLLSLQ